MSLLGRIVGKILAEAALDEYKIERSDLEGLKVSLENLLSKSMEFKAEMDDGRLRTVSDYSIHSLYEEWCEKGCISMIESFAHTINRKVEVKRVHRKPEKDRCEFEFT